MDNTKKTQMPQRILALILALILIVPTLSAFAAEEPGKTGTQEEATAPAPGEALPEKDAEYARQLSMTEAEYLAFRDFLWGEVEKNNTAIDLRSYRIPYSASDPVVRLISDNPEFFHLMFVFPSAENGMVSDVVVLYEMSEEERRETVAAAEKLLAGVADNDRLTDVEKALILHDRLVTYTEYDHENYVNGTLPGMSYHEYGILVKRTGVCQGYLEVFNYLLYRCGIASRECSSYDMNHGWNIVTLDGEDFYVDCTWDDPVNQPMGNCRHDYFLISYEKLLSDGDHDAEDFEVVRNSGKYDDAIWTQVDHSPFVLVGDEIYCFNSTDATLCRWNDGTLEPIFSAPAQWSYGSMYWGGNFTTLVTDGEALYFNLPDRICRYLPGETTYTDFFMPDATALPEYYSVFGMELTDGTFTVACNVTPNNPKLTEYLTYTPGTERHLAGIYVQKMPWFTSFPVGGKFDPAGMVICARYDDLSSEILTSGYEILPPALTQAGTQTVTVTYGEYSASFDVTVCEPSRGISAYYNPNGGLGETIRCTVEIPCSLPWPGKIFSRVGYDFVGWNTSPYASYGYTDEDHWSYGFDESWLGDWISFYAIWERNSLVFGDVDGNGTVNGRDLVILRRYLADYDSAAGLSSLEVAEGSDANGDGTVSALDLALLRRYLADYDYVNGVSGTTLGS